VLSKLLNVVFLGLAICGVCFAQAVVSTTFDRSLPDTISTKNSLSALEVHAKSVLPHSRTHEIVDPGLKAWMKTYAEQVSPNELTKKEFKARATSLSSIESLALRLGQLNFENEKSEKNSKLDVTTDEIKRSAKELFEAESKSNSDARHPIIGEVASLYLKNFSSDKSGEEIDVAKRLISESPIYSCAQKSVQLDYVKRQLIQTSAPTSINNGDAAASKLSIQSMIDLAKSYDSLTHRRQLLEAVATALPVRSRTEWQSVLFQQGGNLPVLVKRHPWIVPAELQKSDVEDVENAIKGNHCQKAEDLFASSLKSSTSKWTIAQSLELGTKVEKCVRGRSLNEVQKFWSKMSPFLESKYGKDGASWADFRVAQFMWSRDLDDPADEILTKLLGGQDRSPNDSMSLDLRAKIIALKARVAEGRNQIDDAIRYFSMYVKEFPAGEDFEASFNTLVVSHASKGDWNTIEDLLKRYVDSQALVSMDKRPVGLMAFSLFWLGRSYVGLSQQAAALQTWHRLSTEYYSTFYGALGHFLLERTHGVAIALEPSKLTGFDFDKLLASLTPKNRDVATRTLGLLKVGLFEQARCESEELVVSADDNPNNHLVRAMILYASGGWLDAIRIYDSLPRSFRSSLPSGFEQILFPRKYSDLVVKYSDKLKLDPDLVFAVMRQESVFAKEAVSPVGAMGLMQLMPATANLELRKLPEGYVEQEIKGQLSSLSLDETMLLDPTLNVPLGVHHLNRLLQIYKSPVFALASYNASPAAAIRWKKNIPSDDILVFIERIPYKETRSYVKLILRNYFYYKRWYGPSEAQEALHLDFVARDLLSKVKEAQPENVDHSRF
jgi:hypothetical protein